MKIIEILNSLNIQFVTEGHKHCRPGWVNMPCPFCTGNPGQHLGFDMENEFFRCWRCGWHPILETLHQLSGVPHYKIKILIREFGGKTRRTHALRDQTKMKAFRFPSDTHRLSVLHKEYLIKRNFDPEYLNQEWNQL